MLSDEKNPRGIPKAPFIVRRIYLSVSLGMGTQCCGLSQADVAEYLSDREENIEIILKSFQDAIAYAFSRLQVKLHDPDLPLPLFSSHDASL